MRRIALIGARLCPKDQPQKLRNVLAAAGPSDTAAVLSQDELSGL